MPTDEVGPDMVFQSTKNAKLAVNGICNMMTMQYLESQGFNGEDAIKMYYGNYQSNNFNSCQTGWDNTMTMGYIMNSTSKYDYYPWYYYYKLIGNANLIIANIDRTPGAQSEREFIKAQALTFRAYSFLMLSQLYCQRWKDTNGGNAKGLVLRIDTSDGDMPLSTLKETYEQIYKDLDDAIALYQSAANPKAENEVEQDRDGDDNYSPNMDVAYAVYARAAITRQDYSKALQYAALARANYPLMSTKEYMEGFSTPNSEWIWSSYGAATEQLHYYSYFAYVAYNSSASAVRNYPKCIDKMTYEALPQTDIRRQLFLDPEDDAYSTSNGLAKTNSALYKRAFALHPNMNNRAKVAAYMQFKINATDMPGVGHLNHFRSSEMLLIEAECKYFLGDEPGAQDALLELTRDSGRDPEYTCDKTGDDLLAEIKYYRSVELWGEGINWFDLKRWGDPLVRKGFKEGSNWRSAIAYTIEPGERNGWTWVIPNKESDYNFGLTGPDEE